ncbi:MAG: hypothetical protein JSV36_08465, partial [Anaerolineae bacterium]
RYPLPVGLEALRQRLDEIEQQVSVYRDIVRDFEVRYGCDLVTFEQKIAQGRVPEHPSWEDSIEWGVALDELERLGVTQKALQWILNFSA